jgi:hypothetical protein
LLSFPFSQALRQCLLTLSKALRWRLLNFPKHCDVFSHFPKYCDSAL